jgi:hypothetical protein
VALLEKRGFLYNHSGDFPQVILIVPSHVPNKYGHSFIYVLNLMLVRSYHALLSLAFKGHPLI